MLRSRIPFVSAALLLAATATAGAQHWSGGSTGQTPHAAPPAAHAQPAAPRPANGGTHIAAAAWNGVPSQWGGSPPERRHDRDRGQRGFAGPRGPYIPIVVVEPYPVAVPVDTAYAPDPEASVQMPIVTTRREQRQLTTIEVYRLQPRFQKP